MSKYRGSQREIYGVGKLLRKEKIRLGEMRWTYLYATKKL